MGLVKFGSGNGETAATDLDCLSLNEIGLGMIVRGTCLRVGAEPEGPTWFNVKAYLQSASTSKSMAPAIAPRSDRGGFTCSQVCLRKFKLCIYCILSLQILDPHETKMDEPSTSKQPPRRPRKRRRDAQKTTTQHDIGILTEGSGNYAPWLDTIPKKTYSSAEER